MTRLVRAWVSRDGVDRGRWLVERLARTQAAALFGLEVSTLEIRQAQDALKAFEALRGRSDALSVCMDAAIIRANRIQINTLALHERLPTMHGART